MDLFYFDQNSIDMTISCAIENKAEQTSRPYRAYAIIQSNITVCDLD